MNGRRKLNKQKEVIELIKNKKEGNLEGDKKKREGEKRE